MGLINRSKENSSVVILARYNDPTQILGVVKDVFVGFPLPIDKIFIQLQSSQMLWERAMC